MNSPTTSSLQQGGGRGDEFLEITLRPTDVSDADDFMQWASDDRATQFCHLNTFTSREQAVEYLTNIALPHPYFRSISLKNHDRAIGAITVSPNPGEHRCSGEIGYIVSPRYWGKGIATQAVRLLASSIFHEWPHLERLEALVDVENTASQRVLEKAGFQRDGVLRKYLIINGRTRDMVMFSFRPTHAQVDHLSSLIDNMSLH
ncbi:hypothetical protein Dimus_024018 [Dionaea muscipula]